MDVDERVELPSEFIGMEIADEVELFVSLLVAIFMIDNEVFDGAVELTTNMVLKLEQLNRRTLDLLSAKIYFYYARAYELSGDLKVIRPKLLQHHRTAVLRHNYPGQVALTNLILRNYLEYNLFSLGMMFGGF